MFVLMLISGSIDLVRIEWGGCGLDDNSFLFEWSFRNVIGIVINHLFIVNKRCLIIIY